MWLTRCDPPLPAYHVSRQSARAKIRVMVRRILRKHGYPPDLQAEATKLVLEQAEALCADWAA